MNDSDDAPEGVESTTGLAHALRWIDHFNIFLAIVGGLATVGLMINIVADVAGRFLFHHPFPGTLDLTQFGWMPVLVSLGLGYALLRGEQIRVNLLTAPTGPRTQRVIEILGMAFTLGTAAFFAWFSVGKAVTSTASSEASVGTAWLAIWPSRWVIVIGLLGLLLQALAQLFRAIIVEEFRPIDDEAAASLEAEQTIFEELDAARRPLASRDAAGVGTNGSGDHR